MILDLHKIYYWLGLLLISICASAQSPDSSGGHPIFTGEELLQVEPDTFSYESDTDLLDTEQEVYEQHYVSPPVWDSVGAKPQALLDAAEWQAIVEGHSYPRENEDDQEKREKKEEQAQKSNSGIDFGEGFLDGIGVLAWVLCIALILAGIGYLIFRQQRDTSVSKRSSSYGLTDELLEQSDEQLQDQLDIHLASGNYRDAIRYRFGQVLQMLRKRSLLSWVPGKTNQDYHDELPLVYQKTFALLAAAFSHAFYSGKEVDRAAYDSFANTADKLYAQLGERTLTTGLS